MVKYKVWDKQSDLYPPAGAKLTPADVFDKWGWTQNPDAVVLITEEGGTLLSIDNLEVLKANHGVAAADTEEAIAALEAIANAPVPEPTPETTPMTQADAQLLGQAVNALLIAQTMGGVE